jgi:hypothetical protein
MLVEILGKTYSISQEDWYSVDRIHQLGLVLNTNGKPCRFTIYRLIRKGRLLARDFGSSGKPRYLVYGSDLIDFLNQKYKKVS